MNKEERFEKLRNYQEVLMERVSIEKEIHDLPKSISAQEEVLSRAKKSFTERNTRFIESSNKVRDLRQELADVVQKKEKAEQQMDSISSPREFEILNKEITEAGQKEDQLRRDLKHEEEVFAEAEIEVKSSETLILAQEAEINEKREKIRNDEDSMCKRIEYLKEQEQIITKELDPEEVFKIERIIKSKNGLAIVPLKGLVCSGCSMILPAQFVIDVKQSDKTHFCPYCSRILDYNPNEEEEEDNISVEIESGALSDFGDFGDDSDEDGYDDELDDGDKDSMDVED